MADDQHRGEINRLYWGSDASVGEIADRLGVSRRALYDSIDARPSGAACHDCGAELGFRNRTAAERGEASCAACGSEQRIGAGIGAAAGAGTRSAARPAAPGPDMEQEARASRLSPIPPRRVPGTAHGPVLGGALLAGVAAGVVVGYLIRRS